MATMTWWNIFRRCLNVTVKIALMHWRFSVLEVRFLHFESLPLLQEAMEEDTDEIISKRFVLMTSILMDTAECISLYELEEYRDDELALSIEALHLYIFVR